MTNSSQDVAVTVYVSYRVAYTPAAHAGGVLDSEDWGTRDGAVASIEATGPEHRADFAVNSIGPGWPLAGQQFVFLGWFTERAVRDVKHVFVRVRVQDRVGDTHERVIDLLKAADRSPTYPDPPLVQKGSRVRMLVQVRGKHTLEPYAVAGGMFWLAWKTLSGS